MLFRFLPRITASMQGRVWTSLLALAALLFALVPNAWAQNAADGYAPTLDGDVNAIVVQPDGKALIGGEFTQVDSQPCHHVCRLLADGRVDTSFIDPAINSDGDVYALAMQPDGKLLVGGSFTTVGGQARNGVARLNANGSLDTTFIDPAVHQPQNNPVRALAVQANGKLLVGGYFTEVAGQARHGIARLNANGSFDTTFIDPAIDNDHVEVSALAVQADGKLLVGGNFTTIGGQARHSAFRLNANGSLDTTFVDPGIDDGAVRALAVQADGKLLVGGAFTQINSQPCHRVCRLLADGNLDTSFIDPAIDGAVYALAMQPDGKLFVGGLFAMVGGLARHGVTRLNADGTPDSGFADLGVASNMYVRVAALAVQPDGRLLAGGYFAVIGGQAPGYLARQAANGHLDADFGDGYTNNYVFALAPQPDGKVLAGGSFTSVGGHARGGVARLRPDGSVDGGFETTKMTGGEVFSLNPRPDGKVLVGGSFTQVREELLSGTVYTYPLRGLALLDQADGKVDTSFHPAINGTVYGVDLQPDGGILIGGDFTTINGTTYRRAARLEPDGNLDASFADPRVNDAVLSLARQPDGKVLLGGAFTSVLSSTTPPHGLSHKGVARFKADGSLDSSFHDPGVTGSGSDIYRSVMALALQADGKVLVGGAFDTVGGQSRKYLARLNADGSLDTSFPDLHLDGMVTSLALQADGKVLIGGAFTQASTPTYIAFYNGIARLGTNGYPDITFANPEANGAVYALALQGDGKLLAGGGFTMIGNLARSRVARLSLPDAALQSLAMEGNAVVWHRGGSAPELSAPPILTVSGVLLTDGTMTRTEGGWRYGSVPLPFNQFTFLRVAGSTVGGAHNASHGPVESALRVWGGDDVIFANGFELETSP